MDLNGETAAARLAALKIWQAGGVAGALIAISLPAMHQFAVSGPSAATPNARVADAFRAFPINVTTLLANLSAALPTSSAEADSRPSANEIVAARFRDAAPQSVLPSNEASSPSETPPPDKPRTIALAALRNLPLGTPVQEIERVADAFDLDVRFMKAVAKIESDFNPKNRTGSYIGLFQLSRSEFNKYGSGNILSARDNAMAAAYKFASEAALFEVITGKKPTFSDLYLIHQQGWEGAAEHVSHPQRLAWKSMCATQEGIEKGEEWCKRAIWGNTLPAVKREWKSVNHLTSGAFVAMWRRRVDTLYARLSPSLVANGS